MSTYKKTSKGTLEIETREFRLSPRLRTTLILVDGHRGDTELRRMIVGDADETLRTLLEQGFIEVVAASAPAPAPAAAPPAAPPPVPAAASREPAPTEHAASAPPLEVRTLSGKAFEQMRRDAVRAFADAVGPMSEALAIKMEKARTHDDLRPLLGMAMNIILNTRGSKVAGDFSARFMS